MGLAKDIVKDNKKILLLALGLLVMSVIGVFLLENNILKVQPEIIQKGQYSEPKDVLQEGIDYHARIRTEFGDIEIDLYEEQSPNAVNSFVFLAGEDFYDGLTFHKVIKDFVVQAGDQVGDGTGDPGYTLEPDSNSLKVEEYSVCMANASQFFIVPQGADSSQFNSYPVIGKVIDGFAVINALEKVSVDENYKPLDDITINSVLIIEK
jgi:cyclophilin family peptidyl-prolyl cis-trans isomerase